MGGSNKNKDCDIMTNTIERIISYDNSVEDNFRNYQQKRIQELKTILEKQNNGEEVDISDIIQNLKEIGILNEDNTWSSYYKPEE